ncbi:hypothetical protein V1525DRAFT_406548 [Lipomyces kononenkoae]|uniref:Uncharacterized protein n=1 Tax=Lipomyces kononenkoae TaxID=34357 RepID=A0ACC3SZ20_LIPKO
MDSAGEELYASLMTATLIICSYIFMCSALYPPRRASVRLSNVFVNAEYPAGRRLVDVLASNYHVDVDGDAVLYEYPYQPLHRKGIKKFIVTKSLAEVKRTHWMAIFLSVILLSAALAFGLRGWKLYNTPYGNYPQMMLNALTFSLYGAWVLLIDWIVRQNHARGNRTGCATVLFNVNERTWSSASDSVISLSGNVTPSVKFVLGFVRIISCGIGTLISASASGVLTWAVLTDEEEFGGASIAIRAVLAVVYTMSAIISGLVAFKCCKLAMNALRTASVTKCELEFGPEVHDKDAAESTKINVEDVLNAFADEILDPFTGVRISGNGTSYDFAVVTVDGGVVFGRLRPSGRT